MKVTSSCLYTFHWQINWISQNLKTPETIKVKKSNIPPKPSPAKIKRAINPWNAP